MTDLPAYLTLALTASVFAFLIPFAMHRSWLLFLSRREREEIRSEWPEDRLPRVTVQLPMYNEREVAARVIDAVAGIDYPSALLEIQILDDSDDETVRVVDERVEHWLNRGLDIRALRRAHRTGYKAGALARGAEVATGDFLLVFDADFVPESSVLRELLAPMQDPAVGMVQGSWGHINRTENWLTESQACLLDGHFLFEQGGRYRGERFFNFNGTAGLWRRDCLEAAGGWSADTLTEDLDLSYRAQLAGWRFAYLDDVMVPAEIPTSVLALEVQQRRWAQGGVQTGRKLLRRILSAPLPLRVKAEAIVHLFGHLAHPLTWMLGLLLFPSAVARRATGLDELLPFDIVLFAAATVPFVVFYWTAGELRGVPRRGRLRAVMRTLALGIGLSVPVSRAVLRGLVRSGGRFERTPKKGMARFARYRPVVLPWDALLKTAMAGLMTIYLLSAIRGAYWGQIPFILLFLSGYAALGVPAVREQIGAWRAVSGPDEVMEQEDEEREPEGGPEPTGLEPVPTGLIAAHSEVA